MKKREFFALTVTSTLVFALFCGCYAEDSGKNGGQTGKPIAEPKEIVQALPSPAPSAQLAFWENTDGTLSVCGIGNCTDTDIVIPRYGYDGKAVTAITNEAFKNCTNIKSMTVQSNIKSIGDDAFYGCSSLENIELHDSLKSIGSSAFLKTKYYENEENWEDGVLYIGNNLIKAKPVVSGELSVKDGTLLIADKAFLGNSNINRVNLPSSLRIIGESAFNKCTALVGINIPGSVECIPKDAFYECEALENLSIENGVQVIGEDAFYGCKKLTSLTLPESIERVEAYAFSECKSLSDINLPDKAINFVSSPFHRTAVYNEWYISSEKTLYIGNHLINVKPEQIRGAFIVREGTRSIAGFSFKSCESLTEISLGNDLGTIGYSAFGNCTSLATIRVGSELKIIDDYAFWNCYSLKNIYYEGKIAQWNAIKKGDPINADLAGCTVQCSDGNIRYNAQGK